MNRIADCKTTDPSWKNLYRIGGLGALIGGVLTIVDIMVFVVWPQPSSVLSYFTLFHKNWLNGLLDFDLLGMIIYLLVFPTLLALYVFLRRESQSWMAIGTALAFLAIAVYLASNTAGPMLSLSNQYAASTTEAQRAMYLAAGQAMLAIFYGPAFTTSFLMISMALLMVSFVMVRSNEFTKRIAYVGILVNLAGLGEFVPAGLVTLVLAVVNGIGLGVWFILIGWTLFQLGRDIPKEEAIRN